MVVFGVGSWIKDSGKKEVSRLRRDSCRHYNRHSGSCFKYKVICCHNCNGFEIKKDKRKDNEIKISWIVKIMLGDIGNMENVRDRNGWILDHCEMGKKIIDIGSQDGHVFANTSFQQYVTSVDLDKYDFPGFVQMDAHDLRFSDKEFDIAILGEILEHVKDSVQVIKEANRVAKRILITVPNEYEWDKLYYPFQTIEEDSKRTNRTIEQMAKDGNPKAIEFNTEDGLRHLWHCRYYTENTLRKDLEDAGVKNYKLEKLQYSGWSFFTVDTDVGIGMSGTSETSSNVTFGTEISSNVTFGTEISSNVTFGTEISVDKMLSKTGKLRIALVSTPFFGVPPLKYGGLEQIVWDLAEGLDELGHTVTIFAPEGSKVPKNGMLVTTGPAIDTVGVNWFAEEEKRYFKWKEVVNNDRYDVVCGHDWFGFEYFHKMNNLKLKVTHVHHGGYIWDTAPPFPKPNLIAISKFMKDYTIAYFKQKGFNVDCRFVHNGIDLSKYIFDPSVKKTDRLLYVGRFSVFKQPDMAIRVATKVGLSLDLIGGSFVEDPNYMQQLEKMCDGENVVMYKDASHEFKIQKLQEAKAVIIPSKMNEPFNLVSIETQACGTPVIVTRDGGLPETVNHGISGFICDTEEQMIEAVKNIDKINPEDCRKHVEDNFSRLKMAKEYEKLFYQIVKGEDW